MSTHPNALLMQRAYDAFAVGDLTTLRELMRDDAVWHTPGHSPIAGDYVGREAILEFFGRLQEQSAGTYKAEVVDILADDARVVAIQHSTAHRDHRDLDARDVLVVEVRDGKFATTQMFAADPDAEDAFWS